MTAWRVGAVLALLVGCVGMTRAGEDVASVNAAGTHIRARQTWYAFVGEGERLQVSFTKVVDTAGTPLHDLVVTVRGPGGVTARCRVADALPVRRGCGFAGLTSPVPGVWAVEADVPGASCPIVGPCAGRDGYSWAVVVHRGTTTVPGRVWTERYEISHSVDTPPVDLSYWYVGEHGYTYRATFRGYHGGDSTIAADDLGVVRDFTCEPVHASSDALPAADGWCGGVFKVFFEAPADDLPVEAKRWDGSVEWVRPRLSAGPVIRDGRFTPVDERSGTLAFELEGYSGRLVVGVNGARSIPLVAREGAVEVRIDGVSGPTTFEVVVERIGEIHFVSADVEVRAGGIEVTRLTGPAAGAQTLHWDDRPLAGGARCSRTPVLDGRAGVDSAGGVHAWGIDACGSVAGADADDHVGGGWGDVRVVDDWAYLPVRVTHTVVVP